MTSDYGKLIAQAKSGYLYEKTGDVGFFRCAQLKDMPGLDHGFSTRTGGVSRPPYNTLNLGWSRPEPQENVTKNFEIFCDAARFDYNSMVIVNYEHGNNVLAVDSSDAQKGFSLPPLAFCDGLVTNDPGITLITSHADCGTFFLYDPVQRVIALAHSGWKGTLGRIGERAVSLMCSRFGSLPENIIASNGPCISRDCFEVDLGLALEFEREFNYTCHIPGKPGKAQLDLEAASFIQLVDAGIPPQNITLMHACTYTLDSLFFSHRRDNGETGSMAAYMRIL